MYCSATLSADNGSQLTGERRLARTTCSINTNPKRMADIASSQMIDQLGKKRVTAAHDLILPHAG